jgi:hypothetical protein
VKFLRLAFYSLCFSALGGCVALSPLQDTNATPDIGSGYIASAATTGYPVGHAIYLKHIETGDEFVLKVSGKSLSGSYSTKDDSEQVFLIKVPLGNYVATHWATFGWLVSGSITKKEINQGSKLAESFAVEPGTVVFLGEFTTSDDSKYNGGYITTTYRLQPLFISLESARDTFAAVYPAFKGLKFVCQLCSSSDSRASGTYRFY